MLSKEDVKKIMCLGAICFVITVAMNIIFYGKLPSQIPINTRGEGSVAKSIFVLIFPALILICNGLNIKLNNRSVMNAVLANILLTIVNMGIIMSKVL